MSLKLSFSLKDEDEDTTTWRRLRDRHPGKTDKYVFGELWRRERIRQENRLTHSDMLADIRQQLAGATMVELKALLLRVIEILEDRGGLLP